MAEEPKSRRAEEPRSRRAWLGLAVIVAGLGFGWLLNKELALPDTLTREEYLAQLRAREPAMGTQVPMLASQSGKLAKGNTLLVMLGACTECTKNSNELVGADFSRFGAVAAVTTSEILDLSGLPAADVDVQVVNDTAIHQALNAYWAPKLALLDHEGMLLAIQHEYETAEAFISRCPYEE